LSRAIHARHVPTYITWLKKPGVKKYPLDFPFGCNRYGHLVSFLWGKYFDGPNNCMVTLRQLRAYMMQSWRLFPKHLKFLTALHALLLINPDHRGSE
jgi:hypothetical protein